MSIDDDICPTCGSERKKINKIIVGGKEITCNCEVQKRKAMHYEWFGIPKEYWYIGWEDYTGSIPVLKEVKEYLVNLETEMKRNIGLFLNGYVGTGKTFLSIQILKEVEARGYDNCKFVGVENIVSMFAARWKDPLKQQEFEREIMEAEILVIDDLGKEFQNRLVESVFDGVMRNRQTPTIITSNININEVKGHYGASIYSLFKSKLIDIKMVGHDFRQSKDLRQLAKTPVDYRPIK